MRGKGRARKAVAMAVKRGKGGSADSGNSGKSPANAALVKNDALVKDVPQEVSFWLSDGRIIRSAVQLADAARTMPDEVYEYHASQHKNDFADWVRDIIKDGELAYAVRKAANKTELGDAIRKRLKDELRIEEPERTILEEPVAKATTPPKPAAASVAVVAKPVVAVASSEPRIPQLAGRKGDAFSGQVTKLKAFREKAAGIKNKTIISLPKKAVRAVVVAGSVKAVKAVKPIKSVKPVVSPSDKHNAALKNSSIATKQGTAAKAAKKTAKKPKASIKSEMLPEKKITHTSDPAQLSLEKREAELVRKERELNEEEQKLNHAKVELIKKRYELLKERGNLEKEKFESFISKRIDGKLATALDSLPSQSSPPASSVHFSRERVETMIREARESIAQGNSHGAAEKFLAAQSLLSRTPLEPSEKRVLNYDLMELEADIRLEKLKAVQ